MIYLDYNGTTPVDPQVAQAMIPFLTEYFGNPSSSHEMGQRSRQAVDVAREQVAALIGAEPDEILFTSSGTESNNYVIKGVAMTQRDRGRHIVTSAIEHPAIVEPCKFLEREGWEVEYLGVDEAGCVDADSVVEHVKQTTVLLSVMHANNETGTIQNIAEMAEVAQQGGFWMHTDAAQSVGKIPIDVKELGVDFLTIAGHKLYAPLGVGALYVRRGVSVEPLLHGASQEKGRRASTEAVPAVVGLGKAAELAKEHVGDGRLCVLRDRLHMGLSEQLGDMVVLIGHKDLRLPNTLNIGFRGRNGRDILKRVPQVCASVGAACHDDGPSGSAVHIAMDVPLDVARGAIRLSVGRFTTEAEVDEAIRLLVSAVKEGAGADDDCCT